MFSNFSWSATCLALGLEIVVAVFICAAGSIIFGELPGVERYQHERGLSGLESGQRAQSLQRGCGTALENERLDNHFKFVINIIFEWSK